MKVAWKYIKSGAGWSGPYAYLQDTVRKGKKVSSVHVAYLGAAVSAGQSIQHKTPKGTVVQAVVPKPPPPPAEPPPEAASHAESQAANAHAPGESKAAQKKADHIGPNGGAMPSVSPTNHVPSSVLKKIAALEKRLPPEFLLGHDLLQGVKEEAHQPEPDLKEINADLSDLGDALDQHSSVAPSIKKAEEAINALGATPQHLGSQIGAAHLQLNIGNFAKADAIVKAVFKDIKAHQDGAEAIHEAQGVANEEANIAAQQLAQSAKDSLDKGWYEVAAQSANDAIVVAKQKPQIELSDSQLLWMEGVLKEALSQIPSKDEALKSFVDQAAHVVAPTESESALFGTAKKAKAAKTAAFKKAAKEALKNIPEDVVLPAKPISSIADQANVEAGLKTAMLSKAAKALEEGQPVEMLLKPGEKKALDEGWKSGGAGGVTEVSTKLGATFQQHIKPKTKSSMTQAVALKLLAINDYASNLKGEETALDMAAQADGIQESGGASQLPEAIESGAADSPKATPKTLSSKAIMDAMEQTPGDKNWDKDLELIEGQKGSNAGGLYKDRVTQARWYVKWPSSKDVSGLQTRIERLASLLYQAAEVPTPGAILIPMVGQVAIASEWINDVKAMSVEEMEQHSTVRQNFVVDAWLANWDVVGLDTDNIVKGPAQGGTEAYRIDPGGSLVSRAQGKPKPFDVDAVPELKSMRDPSKAPQASKVFGFLTLDELKAGAAKVVGVGDTQIDEAVDLAIPPGTSYTMADGKTVDLPAYLKKALKGRRAYIEKHVLKAKPPKELSASDLKSLVELSDATIQAIIDNKDSLGAHSTGSIRKGLNKKAFTERLGATVGEKAQEAFQKAYMSHWKSNTINAPSNVLRWAVPEMTEGDGKQAERMMRKFWEFKSSQGASSNFVPSTQKAYNIEKAAIASDLLVATATTKDMNSILLRSQKLGKTKQELVTLYRSWRPDQVEFLELGGSKVGDIVTIDSPTVLSWTLRPKVFSGVSPGMIRTKVKVPVDSIAVTDRLNNWTGTLAGEDEVLFYVPKLDAEVIKVG